MLGAQVQFRLIGPKTADAEAAIALSKLHQHKLGMLPFKAFHVEADKGHLIGAFVDDALVGYVVFRVSSRNKRIALTQLCVSSDVQRGGYAAGLLTFLCERFPGAPGIVALCREDYDATKAWPKLGFHSTGSRKGRSREGHLLVQWWRPLVDQTLFTFESDVADRPAAALDTNVFRDLYQPRPEHVESAALLDDWLESEVDFVVTAELETEIQRHSKTVPSLVGTVRFLRKISKPFEQWNPNYLLLREGLKGSGIGEADLRQIAQASVGGARFFVTRDKPILNCADGIEALVDLRVLNPSSLLLVLHAQLNESDYHASAVLETQLVFRPPTKVWVPSDLRSLADNAINESASALVHAFTDLAAGVSSKAKLWSVEDADGTLVAVAGSRIEGRTVVVPILRVSRGSTQLTYARQLIHKIRSSAVSACSDVKFTHHLPTYLIRALIDEGFRLEGDSWRAMCEPGFLRAADRLDDSYDLRVGDLRPTAISEAEKFLWPKKVISGLTPTYVVPVRPHFARALFGQEPGQQSFLPRPDRLGLAREHVYYRSVARRLEWPARMLWYVSGVGDNGGFRAASWLDEVVTARPSALLKRFHLKGIYTEDEVKNIVKKPGGEVSALLFSRTEAFNRAVSLTEGRKHFEVLRANGFLQSTKKVDEHMFETFYRLGMELHD